MFPLRICRNCHKPVALNDVKCIHCKKKLLPPIYFKALLAVMVILLLIGLAVLLYGVYAYAQACAAVNC